MPGFRGNHQPTSTITFNNFPGYGYTIIITRYCCTSTSTITININITITILGCGGHQDQEYGRYSINSDNSARPAAAFLKGETFITS